MTLDVDRTLLSHAFLRGLPPDQLAALSPLASVATFEEDELILHDGEASTYFCLVTHGSVAIELRAPRYVVCVQALGPDEAFGWSALLDHQDTLFQVRAREHTTVLRFDGAALKGKLREAPDLGMEVLHRALQLVAGRVRATELRFAEMCGVRP